MAEDNLNTVSTDVPETLPDGVFIVVATTADGFIARNKDHVATWTSKEDKKRFVKLTKEARVIVMGSNTFKTLPGPLKGRLSVVYTSDTEKLASSPTIDTLVNDIGTEDAGRLVYTNLEPSKLIQKLNARGFKKIAICGGSSVYNSFMESGLVDRLYITIEPLLFGSGMSIFNGHLEKYLELEKLDRTDSGTIFLDYVVKKI
jgi:dihydrofolate reductase